MIVDGLGLVDDLDAARFQTVTKLEILVPVAREALIEPANRVEIAFRNRSVAGQKIQPGKPLTIRRMQRVACGRCGTLREKLVVRAHLDFESDDRRASALVPLQMPFEQIA